MSKVTRIDENELSAKERLGVKCETGEKELLMESVEGECACSVAKEEERKKEERQSEAHETEMCEGGKTQGFGLSGLCLPNNNKRLL